MEPLSPNVASRLNPSNAHRSLTTETIGVHNEERGLSGPYVLNPPIRLGPMLRFSTHDTFAVVADSFVNPESKWHSILVG